MLANNCKLLDKELLKKFEDNYLIEYDEETNEILVKIRNTKKCTRHPADKVFWINASKSLKRKIVFTTLTIDIWLSFRKDSRYSGYSLFEVNNAVNTLIKIYQQPNDRNVARMLKTNSCGIKKEGE